MATSSQDTNIADIAAPASATPTNIGHVLGLNAAKTQDVLVPLSMLRQVIAQELQSALSAITSGSPNVPVLDGGNLKYMTLANFAKVAGEQYPFKFASTGDANAITEVGAWHISPSNYDGWTNLPSDGASSGILWVPFYNSNYWKVQFYITGLAIHYRLGSPFTWKKITIQ